MHNAKHGWNNENMTYQGPPPPITKRLRNQKSQESSITNLYRYIIGRDPKILTTVGALSLFKYNDKGLNKEVIEILKIYEPGVLLEVYWNILGNEETHFPANHTSYSRADMPGLCQLLHIIMNYLL